MSVNGAAALQPRKARLTGRQRQRDGKLVLAARLITIGITRRDKIYDNPVLNARATGEFTGRSGVLDVMVEFGLTKEQALEVSNYLPVWAEFSVLAAGVSEVIAGRAPEAVR